MAMSTTLFAVPQQTLDQLDANPDSIQTVKSKTMYDTYLWQSLSHFMTDDDEEEEDDEDEDEGEDEEDDEDEDDEDEDDDDEDDEGVSHPLDAALNGERSVACSRLENGAFHVVSVEGAAELSKLLAKVNPAEIKNRVLEADLEEVLDGEIYEELEQLDLVEPDEVAAQVVKDLKALVKFYEAAAKQSLGVVMYTT